jgi:hypothetical protein
VPREPDGGASLPGQRERSEGIAFCTLAADLEATSSLEGVAVREWQCIFER